jgi:hypothetical protein
MEDAAQVGQERDQSEVGDEHRDADHALDDHEPAAAVDRQLIGDQRRADLEHHHREADRDRERRR